MIGTEVLIIGGGPAGASCAWALRRRGFDVLILDRESFPRTKLCAGWITPAVPDLLEIENGEYPHSFSELGRIEVSIRGFKLSLRSRQLAVRRFEFDDWLLKRSGAPVIRHTARRIVRETGGYLVDGEYFGRFIVGAGGTACPVAQAFFSRRVPRFPDSLIVTREEEFKFPEEHSPGESRCRLWFFENGLPGYAWYVPKAGGFINVGVGGRFAVLKRRGDTISRHWDLLVETLRSHGLAHGHAYAPGKWAYYLRRSGKRDLRLDNAFIIGDAADLATADMGEGIAPAVQSGILAAEAIAEGRPLDASRIHRWSQPWPVSRILAGR